MPSLHYAPAKPAKTFLAIIAIIAWFALILQQFLIINGMPDNGLTTWTSITRFLIFFTILTNIMVAVAATVLLLSPGSSIGRFASRFSVLAAIGVYILVVGLVYNGILRFQWAPTGWARVADELLHLVIPLLYLIFWIAFVPKAFLRWRLVAAWSIYPAAYLVYALLRGNASGFYPYPFLNLDVLSAGSVSLNCIYIFIAFIIISCLFIWMDKKKK